MSYEEYLGTLDPKTAKRIKTAQEIELLKYPLASSGLTNALGGGIGGGRFTLIYGTASSGKSVVCQQSIGRLWQPNGLVCAYVDVEGTYEKSWGARLGINNNELIYIRSKSAGRIEDELKPHLQAGIDVVIIDSISDIMPETFIDKDGELNTLDNRKQIGAHAKAITALANGLEYLNERTAIVFISQVTTKIEQTYVKLVPHGGKKMEHLPSQIVRLMSSNTDNKQIKGDLLIGGRVLEQPIGRSVEYVVEKNKLGRQGAKGMYDLYYAGDFVGIDTLGEIVDTAEQFGVVQKSGAWYYFGDEKFQGRAKFVEAVKSDEALRKELTNGIDVLMTGEILEVQ